MRLILSSVLEHTHTELEKEKSFFFKLLFWAFFAFIDRRETLNRLMKGGKSVGEDTLQTGHRWDLNLDQQEQVHGVPDCSLLRQTGTPTQSHF